MNLEMSRQKTVGKRANTSLTHSHHMRFENCDTTTFRLKKKKKDQINQHYLSSSKYFLN